MTACTLREIAYAVADSLAPDFQKTAVIQVDGKYACVVSRRQGPPVVAIAGRSELVATEVALHVETRIVELQAQAEAAGVSQ